MTEATNVVNTPGIYYALAYWLASCLIIINSPRKLTIKQSVFAQILFGSILCVVMIVSDGVVALFIPFMILYMAMMFASIYVNCQYNGKTALYFAMRAFIIGEFTASLEWQISYYSVNVKRLSSNPLLEIVFLVVIYGVAFCTFYQLEKRNRKVNQKLMINSRELVSAAAIGVAIFIVSNISYLMGDSLFGSQFAKEIFYIRTLVDFAGVAIFYAYHVQLGELGARLEVEKLQNMLDMQYNNYEMLEQSISVVNQKYHDLKYQIAVLKEAAEKEENIAYLDRMEQEIKAYEAQNKTGNKIIDTILTGKAIYCQNHWIELTSVLDGSSVSFMDDMDISILFGNMLDNAIESVSKIEKKERRLIHLAVAKQKGFLRIRLENCCDEKLTFENGFPVTTKKDKRYHGFGLKSIENTAKKYGGSVNISIKDGWFELRILIPLPR